jgi:colanic acid/amylovoran biosynthesis glycosyltransferase
VIAYITTSYPAVSHTFILREVEALRRRGVAITTTAVRRASAADLLSEQDRRAFKTTHALLPPRWGSVVGAQIFALLRHPRAFVSTLRLAFKLTRPGWRGRVWQVFYFGEAVMAWRHWRRLDVRHVHAHFAAVPADVARLASHFGRAAGCGPRSWSFTMHGPIELWDVSWFGLADKVRHADAVVCISDFARSQLMALVEERHWSKLRVIHCGVDPARYAGVADPPSGRPRILCVGRLVPEKGQAVLLNALALLRKHGVDAELELVGEGPSREALEGLVTTLALGDRVCFAGAIGQDAIDAHYEAASVFCLPSFSEGVPVVLMEAMACRRPVVATAIAGIRELVDDGKSGILVSPGRTDELARALERLLRNPALCQQLGEAGRRNVALCYDINSSAGQLQELFGDLRCEQSPVPANADRPSDLPSFLPSAELARQTTPQSSTAPSLRAR